MHRETPNNDHKKDKAPRIVFLAILILSAVQTLIMISMFVLPSGRSKEAQRIVWGAPPPPPRVPPRGSGLQPPLFIYNETKGFKLPFGKSEKEGWTQGDRQQLQFFSEVSAVADPRTILTLLRHGFFSQSFVSKLSPAGLEKNAASQNAKLCDIQPQSFRHPPQPPAGGLYAHGCWARPFSASSRSGLDARASQGGEIQNAMPKKPMSKTFTTKKEWRAIKTFCRDFPNSQWCPIFSISL